MQLQGLPKAQLGIPRITAAHQQIQSRVMLLQQIRGNMRADVPGSTGQENCHVAPFVPVFTGVASFGTHFCFVVVAGGGICNTRGSRASSGRPSISG